MNEAKSTERTLFGFDFSKNRIGIAVGQELTGTVTPLTTLHQKNHKPDWDGITQLIEEWQPDLCVVGLPLTEDGKEQDASQAARRFANQLSGRYHLPVELTDERFTTREAQLQIQASSMSKKDRQNKANIDKIAAQLILQSWLEHQQ
ncbi:MAG: Holliday junction resolvase RuvX [Gammaproteobacteria bacterium]|jgi:putative Holliday junction resolvase